MSKTYFPTIGLEIHAELKTVTKMFCNYKNDTEEKRPNVNICPICMGHPGTLPSVNKEAVKSVLKVGAAVGGEIADYTEFDRKNYFYPDIPKGYQISQYKYPLIKGGSLCGVELTRIHLEEDTAKSTHSDGDTDSSADDSSLVDFNRAGVPLMELVTEPVITSAEQASAFAKELQLLLRYLGVGNANMEKGEMRVEANISVSADKGKFGTKVEVKNLNSFKSVERAIKYELERHVSVIEEGGKVIQETRGWDEVKNSSFSQRSKEDSHDYRYFPDPDIPKLKISEVKGFDKDSLKKDMPELPWKKRERLVTTFGFKEEEIEVFVQNLFLGSFFEEVAKTLKNDGSLSKIALNYISSDLVGQLKSGTLADDGEASRSSIKIKPSDFAELVVMIDKKEVSSRGAKDILKIMFEVGGSPSVIAKENNLLQQSDEGGLKLIVDKVISENNTVVEEYKGGKLAALQYLIGQCMKASRGSGNPEMFKNLLTKLIG